MNEIFIGAKVILDGEIWHVTRFPDFVGRQWWVSIIKDGIERSAPLNDIIMPEGLNEK